MAYFEFKTNPMYVQGAGSLREIRRYLHPLGAKYLFIMACGPITDQATERIEHSFSHSMEECVPEGVVGRAGVIARMQRYDAENKAVEYKIFDADGWQVTFDNIDKITKVANEFGADVVIGIGGGKVLDLARSVHARMGAKVALIPTAAATNAPATVLSVIYNEDGSRIVGGDIMDYHPDLVMTDIDLIIQAPVHSIIAGIGDCICTTYESFATLRMTGMDKTVVKSAVMTNQIFKDVFLNYGYEAVQAAKAKKTNLAYESVLACIVHHPSIIRPAMFMNMGHVLDEALVFFEPIREIPHGYAVGYAVLPMLVMEGRPDEEIFEYVDFATSIGLPVSLADLKIEHVTKEEWIEACEYGLKSIAAAMVPVKFEPEVMYNSVIEADKKVKDYLASKK